MRLDRNVDSGYGNKYGLILKREFAEVLRQAPPGMQEKVSAAIKTLEDAGIIDWGDKPETEFFVIKLKDKFAANALVAYAGAASGFDPEYARDVSKLAARSGVYHPNCKMPD